MTETKDAAKRPGGAPSPIEDMVDDVFGVDFKLPRTLRDLLLRSGRLADAALAGDRTRYMRPLPLFLALVGVHTALYALTGFDDLGFAAELAGRPERLAEAEAALAQAGWTIERADDLIRTWSGWADTPSVALGSLLWALAIWAMRPSLGFDKSLGLYLVAINAAYLIETPSLVLGWLTSSDAVLNASIYVGFIALFVYTGVVLHRRAASTRLGLALRVLGFVAATIPVAAAVGFLQIGVIELPVRFATGVSWWEMTISSGS